MLRSLPKRWGRNQAQIHDPLLRIIMIAPGNFPGDAAGGESIDPVGALGTPCGGRCAARFPGAKADRFVPGTHRGGPPRPVLRGPDAARSGDRGTIGRTGYARGAAPGGMLKAFDERLRVTRSRERRRVP